MSDRRTKARRRSGHPARVAARQPPPSRQNRPSRRPPGPRPAQRARERWVKAWARFQSAALRRLRARQQQPVLALLDLSRIDFVWAAATAAAAAALFATVLTSHPALGDAPETVAGISSLGILHAPGYPSYVIAAHLFTLIVPVGSEAFRVNLFSLLCAAATIGGVQLLARRVGAPRWASTVAALCLAVGAGFWFYAGFAKHDMFSGLLLLITLHLALDLDNRAASVGTPVARWRLIALGAAFGLGLGSSWPLMVLVLPTIVLVLARRAPLRDPLRLLACGGACLVAAVAVYGFVIVRAGENPALNWGDVTSIGRLVTLVDRSDFRAPAGAPAARLAAGSGRSTTGSAHPPGLPAKIVGDFHFFHSEIGWIGLGLAACGAAVALWRRPRRAGFPLALTFAAGLVGTSWLVGTDHAGSYDVDLAEEGFLLGCYFPIACWMALGLGDLLGQLRLRLEQHAQRLAVLIPVVAAGLGMGIVALSVTEHWTVAHRASQPLADRFAAGAFAELPRRAVLFVWGAEYTQPLIYRQVVFHDRRDVTVVAADGLSHDWYRSEVGRRLHLALPASVQNSIADARSVVHSLLGGSRPVYLDLFAGQTLSADTQRGAQAPGQPVGYVPVGILARAVPGHGVVPVAAPRALAAAVRTAERSAGIPANDWRVWPNINLASDIYSTAALEVARAYHQRHDLVSTSRWLHNVLSITPTDSSARTDLATISSSQSAADLQLIR